MARAMKPSGVDWLGDIPQEWQVAKLKHSIRWKSVKGNPDGIVLSLYRDYGVIPKDSRDDNHNVTSLDTSTYKVVDVGDFVINKMKAWQGSMGVSEYCGIISPAYHVCEITNPNIYKKYFHLLMRNPVYLPEYTRLSTGMRTGQWDLGYDDFKNIPFLIPPYDEQIRIASFLDRKCAEIDSAIADTQRTIEEYKKLKQTIITEAVTKGIRGERPMKDSGIEWIGMIPADWNISRLKYVCQINTEFVDPRTGEYDELPHIGPGNIEKFTGRLTEYKLVKDEGLISGKYHFYPNDIVYGKINPQLGKVAFPQFEGLCSADAYPIHTIGESMETRFLLYFMLSRIFIDATILESLRMGMPKINSTDLMGLSITVPSIEEQKEIVDYIDARSQEMDLLIDAKQQMLEALEAYKKSVIYEYVTGKKEVPVCQ